STRTEYPTVPSERTSAVTNPEVAARDARTVKDTAPSETASSAGTQDDEAAPQRTTSDASARGTRESGSAEDTSEPSFHADARHRHGADDARRARRRGRRAPRD